MICRIFLAVLFETFCSTTREISLVEAFAQAGETDERVELERLSVRLSCISTIADEGEVLILPRMSFDVSKVELTSSGTTIDLKWSQLDREVDEYFTAVALLIFAYV